MELGRILYFHSLKLGELNINVATTHLTHINMTGPSVVNSDEASTDPGVWMLVLMVAVFFIVLKFGQKKPRVQKTAVEEQTGIEEKSDWWDNGS